MKNVEVNGFSAFAIIILFWMFWAMSGFYRVDCALNIQAACDLIKQEYAKKPRP